MIRRGLMIAMCLLVIFSMGGVYATWKYAEMSPQPAERIVGLSMKAFEYPPEEVLPGGDMVEAPEDENHLKLIDLILNENDKNYGMNYNKGVIHDYVDKQGTVYSNQKVQGGNLKFILDSKYDTYGLYYCVEKVSNTLYYAYTFSTNDLATAGGSNNEIVVYRTNLEKTDKWRATVSYLGYASTKSLINLGVSAESNSIGYSIDVTTWHPEYTY